MARNRYLCNVRQSSWGMAPEKTYLEQRALLSLPLTTKIDDHQKLPEIVSCTSVFTKFEPGISKSTPPPMDKWRPKTMWRAPKSRFFRPSTSPFFHKTRSRIALWIHWRTLYLIVFQSVSQSDCHDCHNVIMSKSFSGAENSL